MRDWTNHDRYVNRLYGDIYTQPPDEGHTELSRRVIDYWMSRMTTCKSVLDVGCGVGFCQPMFERWNVSYEGVALGEDVIQAQADGRNVKRMDFNFLEYSDNSFDLIFSRHSAEHSFSPLLSFMEWHRVAKSWLGIVVPAPEWYGYSGQNHYYVLNLSQWKNLLNASGWSVLWERVDELPPNKKTPDKLVPHEYWIMCEKLR